MKIFFANLGAQDPSLSKDAIAELLKVSPETLAKFEESYQAYTLNEEPDDLYRPERQPLS